MRKPKVDKENVLITSAGKQMSFLPLISLGSFWGQLEGSEFAVEVLQRSIQLSGQSKSPACDEPGSLG